MENISATTPTRALTIATQEKSWGQQQRLQAAQSNASALLANGETAEVIRARLDLPRHVFAEAYAGWQEEAMPLCNLDDQTIERLIANEIGGFIRLTMGRYPDTARQEFSDQLLVEFAEVPYSVLGAALGEARRRVSHPERLVPFVFDFIEARLERLRAEGEMLGALDRIVRD